VVDDVPIDNKTLLTIDFMNLKIKLAQSFKDAHIYRVYVHVFIWMRTHLCMSICIYTIFLKKRGWNELQLIDRDPNPHGFCDLPDHTRTYLVPICSLHTHDY
jgi:hypothetical protein